MMAQGSIADKNMCKSEEMVIYEKSPLVRLWTHRIRKFLINLIDQLRMDGLIESNFEVDLIDLVKSTIACVLDNINIKNKLRVYIYDISIACFWLKLQECGTTKISPIKLVSMAKKILGRRVTHGKVLKVLAYIKKYRHGRGLDPIEDIKRHIFIILDNMFRDKEFIQTRFNTDDVYSMNLIDLKLNIIKNVGKYLLLIPREKIVGIPRRVFSAVFLYALLRLLSEEHGGVQIYSSDIERFSGVSRFTILRKYKTIKKYLHGNRVYVQ